jgi:hypothetical protein
MCDGKILSRLIASCDQVGNITHVFGLDLADLPFETVKVQRCRDIIEIEILLAVIKLFINILKAFTIGVIIGERFIIQTFKFRQLSRQN